ncbi:amidohydrolase family protein [soil metagenome]
MMIFSNARLGAEVVDLRIEGGRIVELGALGGGGTDLGGRWILPGLWDQHVHMGQWAMFRRRFDVSGASSAAEAAAIAGIQPAPTGGVLVGVGYRDGLWPDAPTRELLDAAVPAAPVVLISGDLHSCWLNSAALRRFGRDATGDGVLREDDCFAVVGALDDVPADLLDEWVADAGRAAAARGVVGFVDLEMTWSFDDWRRRMSRGFDTQRVRAGAYPQFLDRAIAEGLHTGDRLEELLEVGPFKIITDGSLNTRTAYCIDPYPGMGDYRGVLTVEPRELRDWLRRATAAGLSPAVHAIGDEANSLALDAFEALGVTGRIEHAQLLAEVDFARFDFLGVAASVQPEHAMDDRDIAERYWQGRTGRAFALKSLSAAGAELLMGSDAPVAPLDPWVTMAAAVGRARGREPWHPEQRIPVELALRSSVQSVVAVGERADLVVVEVDPLAASEEQLRGMPVAATLLGGRLTHSTL